MWKAVIDYGMGSLENLEQDSNLAVLLSSLEMRHVDIGSKIKNSYEHSALVKVFFEEAWLESEAYRLMDTELFRSIDYEAETLQRSGATADRADVELTQIAKNWMVDHAGILVNYQNEVEEFAATAVADAIASRTWANRWASQ